MKAKQLILNLLVAAPELVSSKQIIAMCGLFDITANSTRVTLARLLGDQFVQSPGRGLYTLGPAAVELADDLANWRLLEEKVRPWDGQWIAAFIGNLGRADRTALRKRTRILQLTGFAEFEQGLLIRPNNLAGGAEQVRSRLYRLGLEKSARIFTLGDFSAAEQTMAMNLWDRDSLNKQYQVGRQQMLDWMAGAQTLDDNTAARESYMLGGETLRHLAFDPLLPAEMVDVQARKAYIETMKTYDDLGREIWLRLYNFHQETS